MPGLNALLNYHPLFVHFPIALWLAALLFEGLALWRANDEWHRTAVRLLYLGTSAGLPRSVPVSWRKIPSCLSLTCNRSSRCTSC